ncbi:MAG TPA: hypothetical protein VFS21_07295 [Roseiflexaceae bacterium]|nr:hypothetical protein [Roseiflexaceae bacterium]
MHVIHADLDDLAEQVGVGRERAICTRPLVQQRLDNGIIHLSSSLVITGTDSDGLLHAARLPVEEADLMGPPGHEGQVRAAVKERLERALELVEGQLGSTRRGLLSQPGLWDDLARLPASANLWTWEGDRRNPLDRRLVPAAT